MEGTACLLRPRDGPGRLLQLDRGAARPDNGRADGDETRRPGPLDRASACASARDGRSWQPRSVMLSAAHRSPGLPLQLRHTHMAQSTPRTEKINIAHFESWNADRNCLKMNVDQMDTTKYSHIHFAFVDITPGVHLYRGLRHLAPTRPATSPTPSSTRSSAARAATCRRGCRS